MGLNPPPPPLKMKINYFHVPICNYLTRGICQDIPERAKLPEKKHKEITDLPDTKSDVECLKWKESRPTNAPPEGELNSPDPPS